MKTSIIAEKSFAFSEAVVETYKKLIYERNMFCPNNFYARELQLVRMYRNRCLVNRKEILLRSFRLHEKKPVKRSVGFDLCSRTGFLENDTTIVLKSQCEEILRLLTAIIKTVEINSRNS